MVYRVYVEKKEGLDNEARSLYFDLKNFLGIKELTYLRLLNRYDAEGVDSELFDNAVKTVFSEPQLDNVYSALELPEDARVFASEYLPGQFDQRADSAAQCIQLLSRKERPIVKTARVFILGGAISDADFEAIKKYLINPVESREASSAPAESLAENYPLPDKVPVLTGFNELDEEGLSAFIKDYALAMDLADALFCQTYFKTEGRNPTLTEIRVLDTYWSDHCRHTTFLTTIDKVKFENPEAEKTYNEYLKLRTELGVQKPVTLMNLATIGAKYLKKKGLLDKLDESEEINACTVKIKVEIEGEQQDWLLLFKNETHNHPTEIEPFGGAATCIGGAIRDPLSGRAYVYAAMRLTGAADPLKPISETLKGKLPQKKITVTAAQGYSSYGNQIGLATGIVDELYHDGYAAKRMEIGAVIGAVPAANVRRETPAEGDLVILIGGRTGRDGCGGATGSSKSHTLESLVKCGAEVQKGNATEERKLQRLFRNAEASKLIKRCNDFGAGGVSVAIGELSDGLEIDLSAVPKKYEGLDGTELAISESQERMAVVVAAEDTPRFREIAQSENLEATVVAVVKAEPRLKMVWNGDTIVDISREFLNSNGAEKHAEALVPKALPFDKPVLADFASGYRALASDLNVASKKGLSERFDSTIGAGTVLMPFGGKRQLTPIQAMVHKLPVEKGHTDDCSFMSWGFNPYISEKSPYHGAYLAVLESVSKLIASGAAFKDVYLTFQEYFERLGKDDRRWGKPLAALLGALRAQTELGIGAIGGKDSMSGSFENLDVPPTLVSFAVTTGKTKQVISPEFKEAGRKVVLLRPETGDDGLPVRESVIWGFNKVAEMIGKGKVVSAYTPGYGGIAEAIMKMCLGNGVGFEFDGGLPLKDIFAYSYGSFILGLSEGEDPGIPLGRTIKEEKIVWNGQSVLLDELLKLYEDKLEPIFPSRTSEEKKSVAFVPYRTEGYSKPSIRTPKPRVLIPVFPGTNCEYDTARAWSDAGAEPEILVIKNRTAASVEESVKLFAERAKEAQVIFIPGGFSGGDEPDGSGKFITSFLRNPAASDAVHDLLKKRDGLMCGVCNGFQALIKLGLLTRGEISDPDENSPTLTFNTIGRHQSRIVRTVVTSDKSPWLMKVNVGDIYSVPISHGEGRFLASADWLGTLIAGGRIATQYVDLAGNISTDSAFNPNGSALSVEGITSADGRILGKMGHSERKGPGLYKNVPGDYNMRIFESAVEYFK